VAVKLRLMRMGKKKQPTYRVVAADSRKARNGRFIEIVGTYNPRQEPSLIEIDNEKALHWLRHGAQPSERVQKLLVISGAWAEFTGEVAPVTVADLPPAKVTTAASAEVAEAPSAEESAEVAEAPSAEESAEVAEAPSEEESAEVAEAPSAEESAEVAEAPSAEESAEADEGAEAESVEAEEGTEQDAEKAEEEAS